MKKRFKGYWRLIGRFLMKMMAFLLLFLRALWILEKIFYAGHKVFCLCRGWLL